MIHTSLQSFDFSSTTRYPTDQGGVLTFNESFEIEGQISLGVHAQDESDDLPMDILFTRFRVADSEGAVWEAESRFSSEHLVLLMQEAVTPSFLQPFAQAEASVQKLFASGGKVLKNIRFSSDDRFYRPLFLGDKVENIIFKYTTISFDLAFHDDGILERLYCRIHPNSLFKDGNDLGSFVFETSPFIGPNTAAYNEDEEIWQTNPLPAAIVFKKTADTTTPNPDVIWIPNPC